MYHNIPYCHPEWLLLPTYILNENGCQINCVRTRSRKITQGFSLFGYINYLARKKQLDIHVDAMAENMWIIGSELCVKMKDESEQSDQVWIYFCF